METLTKMRNLIFDKGKKFKNLFGIPISRFIDISGFDIIKFDEWLKTPDGTSTADFTEQKFSKEASEFVRSLI